MAVRTESNGDDLARYYPQIRRYLERHASRAYPTDDLAQETFLRAYETVRDRDPPDDPLSWLKGIARHAAADRFRGRRAHEDRACSLDTDVVDRRGAGPDELVAGEGARRLYCAMDLLPEGDARLLYAHYVLELSCRTLGKNRGISEAAVRTRLFRARQRLRSLLEE